MYKANGEDEEAATTWQDDAAARDEGLWRELAKTGSSGGQR